jgi:hypothetical protein
VQANKALSYILSLGVFKTRERRVMPLEVLPNFDRTETHLASEHVLAKDWLNAYEDEAWKDL